MKKKKIRISISFCVVLLITLMVSVYYTDTISEEVYVATDGAMLAVTLDGEKIYEFPSKGIYRVEVDCTNATGTWDYDNWKLSITDLTDYEVYCNIDFFTISTTYLNDYIISLAGTEQGTGELVNENGYRYEGIEPNNYIWYNDELWRIIGVFDEDSHGVSEENLAKIIRVNSIGGLAWHRSNTNDWTASSLNTLLNNYYYTASDATDKIYCSGYSTTILAHCDYTNIGLSSTYRAMIENVTWYLGGYSSASPTTDNFYEYERSGQYVYSGRATSTTGYIGLMYVSDYGYSVLSKDCDRTTSLSSYDSDNCAGHSWLYGGTNEWILTPYTTQYAVFDILYTGALASSNALFGYTVHPTLYLSSSVYILDGSGTQSDPYIIGMD